MKSDLQESYGCIFYFDTYKRLIHVRDVMNDAPISPVYFSVENLVKDVKVSEDTFILHLVVFWNVQLMVSFFERI